VSGYSLLSHAVTNPADRDSTEFRPEPFRCEVTHDRWSTLVAFHGELDLARIDEVDNALRALASQQRNMILDLRGLSFIDSSGLRLIVALNALTRRAGFNFTVVRGPAAVQRSFAITGLDSRLVFVDAPEVLASTRTTSRHGRPAHRMSP
jgi:anti-sigma B factor antagonist